MLTFFSFFGVTFNIMRQASLRVYCKVTSPNSVFPLWDTLQSQCREPHQKSFVRIDLPGLLGCDHFDFIWAKSFVRCLCRYDSLDVQGSQFGRLFFLYYAVQDLR